MNFILRAEEMRAADKYASETLGIDSFQLMFNAAEALSTEAEKMIDFDKNKIIIIFCGKGNNGGDGLVTADILSKKSYKVHVYTIFGQEFINDAKKAYDSCDKSIISEYSDDCISTIKEADLIIDCIFGTGFNGALKPETAKLITIINSTEAKRLSCDIPSGCSCNDGTVITAAVKAHKTVTFATYKPCFFLYPSSEYCGETIVADINLPITAITEQSPNIKLLTETDIENIIVKRPQHSHKGTFGGVQLVCGSKRMTGAAVLAAKGALRSGVGLVYIESGRYVRKRLQTQLSEPVYVKKKKKTKSTAYIVGCGLGKKGKRVKRLLKFKKPLVIDADSISYLGKHPNIMKKKHCETILTPHPLELARLCNTTINNVENDRIKAATVAAHEFNSVVVLKGKNSIIATPQGDVFINTTGNSGLSKGGSGDVLSGVIGSFLAQGYSTTESSLIGVYLHGKAADTLKESTSEYGMLPSDLPETIGKLLKKYE